MKTLIIGARGMLGHELALAFISHKPFLWDLDEIDITVREQVQQKIGDLAPEIIINAAAYTNVDACETNEALATKVNGEAVGYLADIASKLGATLVHYSTDYVFDGSKKEGYVEDDAPNPINAYGRSKLAGEQELSLRPRTLMRGKQSYSRDKDNLSDDILQRIDKIASPSARNDNLKYYLIRTAWLYGVHGKNFVDMMLSLAEKGAPLKVIDDQIGSPTYALDLAQATRELVESGKPSGIYHRTNDGTTSWYGFAKEIFSVFGVKVDLSPCTTADYPLPAKRPAYSILRTTKLPTMRSWQEALRAYAQEKNP